MRRLAAVVLVLVLAVAPGSLGCERAALAHDETSRVAQVPTFPGPYASTTSVDRWKAVALAVGWPRHTWPRLRCIMRKESGGNPRAVGDGGTSFGLLQFHVPAHRAFMARHGITVTDLLDGRTNLRIGLTMWRNLGWKPWAATRRGCP